MFNQELALVLLTPLLAAIVVIIIERYVNQICKLEAHEECELTYCIKDFLLLLTLLFKLCGFDHQLLVGFLHRLQLSVVTQERLALALMCIRAMLVQPFFISNERGRRPL